MAQSAGLASKHQHAIRTRIAFKQAIHIYCFVGHRGLKLVDFSTQTLTMVGLEEVSDGADDAVVRSKLDSA